MDRLRMFAELVEIADRKGLRLDEFRLFVLLFVNYDAHRKVGKVRLYSLAAASGWSSSRIRIDRSLCLLSELGLIEILSQDADSTFEKDLVLYRILFEIRG